MTDNNISEAVADILLITDWLEEEMDDLHKLLYNLHELKRRIWALEKLLDNKIEEV